MELKVIRLRMEKNTDKVIRKREERERERLRMEKLIGEREKDIGRKERFRHKI